MPQALAQALAVGARPPLCKQLLQESRAGSAVCPAALRRDPEGRRTEVLLQGGGDLQLQEGDAEPWDWTGSSDCPPLQGPGSAGPTLARLLTFSWVQMFSCCSFTERLWITLKSQAQKTLTARSPMELPTR